MDKVTEKLQVFFEEPFWVGVFERIQDKKLSVCKITFGAEPKDYEVQEFIMKNYYQLTFSPTVEFHAEEKVKLNPKRLQRDVKKQIQNAGIGTKSQQALKLQQEEGKLKRKTRSREQQEKEQELHFALKQQKRKEKHRGR